MNGVIKTVGLGVLEVGVATVTGAMFCACLPPAGLVVIPACIVGSLVSTVANAIFSKVFNLDENAFVANFAVKSLCVLAGATMAVGALSLLGLASGLLLTLTAVATFALAVGAFVSWGTWILKSGDDVVYTVHSDNRTIPLHNETNHAYTFTPATFVVYGGNPSPFAVQPPYGHYPTVPVRPNANQAGYVPQGRGRGHLPPNNRPGVPAHGQIDRGRGGRGQR